MGLTKKILQEFIYNNLSKQEKSYYGWLYFLVFVTDKLEKKDWSGDKRFNFTSDEAMAFLEKKGFVDITDKYFLLKNPSNAKKKVLEIFGDPSSFEEEEAISSQLQSDTLSYKINQIPSDILLKKEMILSLDNLI